MSDEKAESTTAGDQKVIRRWPEVQLALSNFRLLIWTRFHIVLHLNALLGHQPLYVTVPPAGAGMALSVCP